MKKAGRKCPDRLADSCKCLSVNQMAAGLRLSRCIMDFFLLPATFQTFCPKFSLFSSVSLAGCKTWCPTDLQHFCALKHK